jgi:large subunit ribosomal protein L9e
MRTIQTTETISIPSNGKNTVSSFSFLVVTVELDGRKVKVTGPRGTLERNFSFIPLEITRAKNQLSVTVWFGGHKHLACIRTICAHIKNMIKGVTKGFEFKMRSAYAHFPINLSIVDAKKTIEIRNFVGEKIVRRVPMLNGVTIDVTDQKDEIVLRGADLQNVSQSAATIQNLTKVKNKDIRKFLDGIYVSERSTIEKVE